MKNCGEFHKNCEECYKLQRIVKNSKNCKNELFRLLEKKTSNSGCLFVNLAALKIPFLNVKILPKF